MGRMMVFIYRFVLVFVLLIFTSVCLDLTLAGQVFVDKSDSLSGLLVTLLEICLFT